MNYENTELPMTDISSIAKFRPDTVQTQTNKPSILIAMGTN
jgi:hypothetical protein